MKAAPQSVAGAFPAEAQFLVTGAAFQLDAINHHIAALAKSNVPIEDEQRAFLEAIAVRACSLSGAIEQLFRVDANANFAAELAQVCVAVEGVGPRQIELSEESRLTFGLTDASPIGGTA